jgi:hypothetical protein
MKNMEEGRYQMTSPLSDMDALEMEYRQMTRDVEREKEAEEWCENLMAGGGDVDG